MSRSSTTALTLNSETFGLVAVTIAFRWIRGTAGPTPASDGAYAGVATKCRMSTQRAAECLGGCHCAPGWARASVRIPSEESRFEQQSVRASVRIPSEESPFGQQSARERAGVVLLDSSSLGQRKYPG